MGQYSCAGSARQLAVAKHGIPDPRVVPPLPMHRPFQFRIQQESCQWPRCRRKGSHHWRDAWLCWTHKQRAIARCYGRIMRA